jgi:hypothetical protein
MKITIVKTGVVAKLNGKFFGIQHEDGHSISYGFGEIEKAEVSNPEFCKRPEQKTYSGSPYIQQLRKSKLVHVKITTTYETK